jgi:hypothetical protein
MFTSPLRITFLSFAVVALALLAPFFFPVPVTILFALIAGYFFPPILLVVGGLLDMLYLAGRGIPVYTMAGACGAGLMLFVQQFVKARIMS